MKQNEARKPTKISGRSGNQGFTVRELLIVIACIIFMGLVIIPNPWKQWGWKPWGKVWGRPCLSNLNGLWKAASQWGMDPVQTWRPTFPDTNLASAFAIDNTGVTPEIFICPDAYGKTYSWGIDTDGEEFLRYIHIPGKNKEWGISAATNLASIRATNSNYAYFGGREPENGRHVLIADKNGSNNVPSGTNWGGNHDGKGGNVILAAGQGFWVDPPRPSNDSLYCITNADVAAAFATTGTVYAY